MDSRDILKATDSTKRLIHDETYYKYIFKKTERIVSVVFYILNNVPENSRTVSHIEDIQHAARSVHDAVLQSLESRMHTSEDIVRGVAHALIYLESKLTVAQVSGVISSEVLSVLQNEIDAVLRGTQRYIGEETNVLFSSIEEREPVKKQKNTRSLSTPLLQDGQLSAVSTSDRRARIKTILEAKGEATIRDISDIIKDISEKTIQRELNAMIEDNVVKRQGERRWSKYSIL